VKNPVHRVMFSHVGRVFTHDVRAACWPGIWHWFSQENLIGMARWNVNLLGVISYSIVKVTFPLCMSFLHSLQHQTSSASPYKAKKVNVWFLDVFYLHIVDIMLNGMPGLMSGHVSCHHTTLSPLTSHWKSTIDKKYYIRQNWRCTVYKREIYKAGIFMRYINGNN
jgi:hypothetical protein